MCKGIIVALLTLLFPFFINAGYNEIVECVAMVGGQKKPSISPNACHDSDSAFCMAQFELNAATIGENLNP